MKISRYSLRNIVAGMLLLSPVFVFAVTQKEMEQARVIAAKTYIRYANNGSGYLDELNPKTLEELQSVLKPKEKENIKAFLAIPVPNDYKDWDKQKLVDYWANAFQDNSLDEKGRGGRVRARALLNKMEIAAPSEAKAEEPSPEAAAPTAPADSPVAETPSDQEALAIAGADAGVNPEEAAVADENAIENQIAEDNLEEAAPEEYNYTWVYVMILSILVAIVIALIVYAAKVMKTSEEDKTKGGKNNPRESQDHEETKEKYETAIADKDFEIAMLKKKLETANKQSEDLRSRLENLTAELARVKEMKESPRKEMTAETIQGLSKQPLADQMAAISPAPEPKPQTSLRTIYLGRANAKNIFVRADRNLNPGHSVFVLDTTDGFSGTFRVAVSEEAWHLALSNPEEYLMNACTGHNLEDTNGVSRIITEDSGTAIFEGGCWRVIRKAKIRYE